jgi:O-6-methylguanine DNA methyltransferase
MTHKGAATPRPLFRLPFEGMLIGTPPAGASRRCDRRVRRSGAHAALDLHVAGAQGCLRATTSRPISFEAAVRRKPPPQAKWSRRTRERHWCRYAAGRRVPACLNSLSSQVSARLLNAQRATLNAPRIAASARWCSAYSPLEFHRKTRSVAVDHQATPTAPRASMRRNRRAVAQVCGANPLAVAIPCHRVVRSDGGLSGYRWGVKRKRALLAREAQTRTHVTRH